MSGETEPGYDEEAAMEKALERCAVPPLRDVLKREYEERLKGRPRDIALEEWGPSIEEQLLRNLESSKTKATIIPFLKPEADSES